jgi:7-keto-8-aminopelargonate synthetase-like enzyme
MSHISPEETGMSKLEAFRKQLDEIREAGLYKDERIIQSPQEAMITVGGERVLNFCANNYLSIEQRCAEGCGEEGVG